MSFRLFCILALLFFDSQLFQPSIVFAQTIVSAPYDVSHVAGGPGGPGYSDGIGLQARFSAPSGIWGVNGNLYIGDSDNRTIRRIVLATGEVTTIARLSSLACTAPEYPGHLIPPLIQTYLSVWADSTSLYVSDDCLHLIYSVDPSSGTTTVLSGQVQQYGFTDGPAAQATFTNPTILWGDASYLYVLDRFVRRVDRQTGEVVTMFNNVQGIFGGDGTYLYLTTSVPNTGTLQTLRIDTGEVRTIGTYASIQGLPIQIFPSASPVRRTEGGEDFLYVLFSDSIVRKIRMSDGQMTTFAGGTGAPVGWPAAWKDGAGAEAEFSKPFAEWADNDNLYIVEITNSTVRKINFSTANVTTIAGLPAIQGFDDGPAATARFSSPQYIWGDGNYLYVTEWLGAIRRVRISDGQVSTFAGIPALPINGSPSVDGVGATARFGGPWGIWGDGSSLYVVDRLSYVIRKVDIDTAAVTTIAGATGVSAFTDGPRDQARFAHPGAIWGDGTYLYIADSAAIRRVTIATGDVTTIAGTAAGIRDVDGVGAAAQFVKPDGIWGDGVNLYVTDSYPGTIRKIELSTASVTTLAGTPNAPGSNVQSVDGPGPSARFLLPTGIWGDGAFLYVTDMTLNTIRRVRISDGYTTTIAGMSGLNVGVDDQRGSAATFTTPEGIWGDGVDLYVADLFSFDIRRLTPARTGAEPALVSITPNQTAPGTTATFTITGSRFVPGDTAVVVNGPGTQVVGVNVTSPTSLNVAVQIDAVTRLGARGLRVTQSSGVSNPLSFEVGPAPDLTVKPFSINSGGAFDTATVPSPGAATTGYARIMAAAGNPAPSGLAIYGNRVNGVLVSEAAVPAAAPILAGRLSFDCTGNTLTGLAVLNPNDVTVRLSYTMTRPDGSQFFQGSTVLNPGQQIARFLNQSPFWGGNPAVQGTFSFTATAPVAVIALRGFVNDRSEFLMSTLPVTDLSLPANPPVVFPHVVDGAGWASRIVLTNPTDQTLTGQLQFMDPSGQPLSVVIDGQSNSVFSYSILAAGSQTFLTGNTTTGVHVGWVRIVPSGANYPSGNLVFSYTNGTTVITEAAVKAAPASPALRLYVEKDAVTRTGFAIVNTANAAAQVSYQLSDLKFLMSTVQPVDESAPPNPSELFFPHFVESGGFTTQFLLFPNANAAASGMLKFFSQNGQPLSLPVD
jgi:hypothetical protein